MAFSGALTLTDLNDFITPSQACIKPVEQLDVEPVQEAGAATTEIRIDSNGAYYEVSEEAVGTKKLQQAQISLNDCLACSGCITSAESVLITLQSHVEVLNFLEANPSPSTPGHKVPVISIAPQSLASLAASVSYSSHSPITLQQILRRVEEFSKRSLGFAHVYDTTLARHVSLLEHAQEFMERKRGDGQLPMLASACPGWVCYAEKAHPEMLPFIARTKSPQQIMGTLVKYWLGQKWGKKPDELYHVSVMPCYDKKLEASRKDFYDELYSTRDIDCVITTGELELLMHEKGWDLSIPVDGEVAPSSTPHDQDFPELISHPGTSSGSYLQSLIDTLTLVSSDSLELSIRTQRTSDYEEYTLRDPATNAIVFKGAKCYGFRNLQNVVRKVGREAGLQIGKGAAGRMATGLRSRIKKGRENAEVEKGYDYVEVMACPGGCVNGGGQLRPPQGNPRDEEGYTRNWGDNGVQVGEEVLQNAKWGDREWTKKVEEAYWHDLPTPPESPKIRPIDQLKIRSGRADRLAAQVLVDLCRPGEGSSDINWQSVMDSDAEASRRRLFRTEYRAVESEVIGLAVKW